MSILQRIKKTDAQLHAEYPFHVSIDRSKVDWHDAVKPWLVRNATEWEMLSWLGLPVREDNMTLWTEVVFKSANEAMLFKLTFGGM